MDIRTERHEDKLSRTVEIARYDDQIIGAAIFLGVTELRAVGLDLDSVDRLLFKLVDSRHGPVIKIAETSGSADRNESNSLTD